MALTIAEANSVNVLLRYVLGKPRLGEDLPTSDRACAAAALLAEHAHKSLLAGLSSRDVEAAWPGRIQGLES